MNILFYPTRKKQMKEENMHELTEENVIRVMYIVHAVNIFTGSEWKRWQN